MTSVAHTDTTQHTPLAMPVRILPSQQKLLEQLHYVTTFKNQMVIVAGPQGAGKSTLLESFMEQASDYANIAYLSANAKLTIEHVRQRLLQQISSLQSAPAEASLSKTIRRTLPTLSAAYGQHLMIVIDDAHTLSPVIVDELQELVLHSRFTGGKHRISVVVSGSTDWAARQRTAVPNNTSDAPEIVLVSELADSEALSFAKALLNCHERGKSFAMNAERIQSAIGTCLKYPGVIQKQLSQLLMPTPKARYQVTDNEPEPAAPVKSRANTSTIKNGGKRLVLALLGALLMASGVTAFLYQEQLRSYVQSFAPAAENATERVAANPAESPTNSTADNTSVIASVNAPDDTAAPETSEPELGVAEAQLTMNFDDALSRLSIAAREYQPERELSVGLMRVSSATTPQKTSAEAPAAEPAPAVETAPTEEQAQATEGPAAIEPPAALPESPSNPWLNAHD